MANTGCSGNGIGSISATQADYASKVHGSAGVQGAAVPEGDPNKVNPHWEFGYRVAERFGIPVVLLVVVLWWARTDLIQPLLDAHFSFIMNITDAHEKHVEELQNIGGKLDTLIRISDEK